MDGKEIGVPLGQLICASNENKVNLQYFLRNRTCMYIKSRVLSDESPSMDILISSNFERFLYYVLGSDDKVAAA